MGRMWRRDVRPSSDWEIPMKKPAADFSARAFEYFCDDGAMPVICPTCQILFDAPMVNPRCALTRAPEPAAVRLAWREATLPLWQAAANSHSPTLASSSRPAPRVGLAAMMMQSAVFPTNAQSKALPNSR